MAFPHVLPVESVLAASIATTAGPRARGGQWKGGDSGAAGPRTSSWKFQLGQNRGRVTFHWQPRGRLSASRPTESTSRGVRDRSDLHLIILRADR